MMKKYLLLLVIALPMVFVACSNDDDDDDNNNTPLPVIELTQERLDLTLNLIAKGLSGPHAASPTDTLQWAHDGNTETNPSTTNRDLYGSFDGEINNNITPGTVLAKRVYRRDSVTGQNGELVATFVMHKQNAGYFPGGGDFEFILLPGSSTTLTKPNGDLSQANTNRGKWTFCGDCHSRASGNDFLFHR